MNNEQKAELAKRLATPPGDDPEALFEGPLSVEEIYARIIALQEKVKLRQHHPRQPTQMVGSILRFKENKIISYMIDSGRVTMNDLATMNFPREDRVQFAQLLGYSVQGFSTLSYVEDEDMPPNPQYDRLPPEIYAMARTVEKWMNENNCTALGGLERRK